jgi:hypothetical protein
MSALQLPLWIGLDHFFSLSGDVEDLVKLKRPGASCSALEQHSDGDDPT